MSPARLRWAIVGLLAVAMLPAAAAQSGPAVTVLLFHPNDGVDPFGFAFAASGSDADPYTVRHAPLVADVGRFDYPFFVADGVLPIAALPDPGQPYNSVRSAYGEAVATRQAEQAPLAIALSSSLKDEFIHARVEIRPAVDLGEEDLALWYAVAEDPVRYQPPTGLTNGITDHRFTVRAIGRAPLDFSRPSENVTSTVQITTQTGWDTDALLVAVWVQQGAPSARFDAGEVVQATHAPLGEAVVQDSKGVLVEVLSATWCDPCLYGDLAAEDLAVALGAAEPLALPKASYLEAPKNPLLAIGLSLAFGLGVAFFGRRATP